MSTTFFGGVGLLPYMKILLLFLCIGGVCAHGVGGQWYLKVNNNTGGATADDLSRFGIAAAVFLCVTAYLAFFDREGLGMQEVVDHCPGFRPHQYGLPVFGGADSGGRRRGLHCRRPGLSQPRADGDHAGVVPVHLPVYSGLTHWAKCEQRNHWFGYWFGHDMFTPPFDRPGSDKLSYDPKLREQAMKGPNGNLVYPEMDRNTILFGGTDPGRFCPTYMIFCESFIPHDGQAA